ncbi:MAG: energy transducer TonB [Gemmatimonadetes bacterium]|nr:energy transducer TonB [Gemmatimonadota bacterium]MBP6668168.1 energy transducer TonB [Gemmatimonadales bacterium]MBK6779595.1 energy transducer TonB [Gemmatimonadota bacterium]MBK7350319.1 energy transducer TonB [Gemmatimonadota bacterium]MBK7716164.1 energy transducer TonB [Gemmatimonadota bacterium]
MFENLVESNRKRQNTLGQQVVSLALHGVLIVGAIKATQGAAEVVKDIVIDTTMVFLKPPETPPPPVQPPPENVVVSANPPPQGFQIITPPDNIPTEIPPVNLNERFDPRDFTGKGVEGGIATGVVGGTGPVPTIEGEVFLAAEVDETPQAIDGSACIGKFPPVMMSAGIPGKVVLQFIVNTDGRVDVATLKVISSTHKAFEEPARQGITSAGCNFKPGKSRGQPVRVLVQQAVSFKIGQ